MSNTKKLIEKLDGLYKSSITDETKEYIINLSIENELPCPPITTMCSDCWKDQIILLKKEILEKYQEKLGRKYILKGTVNVIWNGINVSPFTINDKLAKKYIKNGFSKIFFKTIPAQTQDKCENKDKFQD